MADFSEGDALRASLRKVLGGPTAVPASPDADWRHDWPTLVDLGLTSILDPEDGAAELAVPLAMVVAEELAVALHPLPAHALLPASLLRPELEENLADGYDEAVVAFVLGGERLVLEGGTVSGRVGPVCGLSGTTHLVLCVGARQDVVVVATDARGLRSVEADSLDVTRGWSALTLDAVPVTRLAAEGAGLNRLSRLLLLADVSASTAEGVRRTVDYARGRETFGAPIGRYQAVQHRLVEHAIVAEQLADLVVAATVAVIAGADDVERRLLVAEVFGSERSQEVLSDCIQLTGGIGFTWEYGLHYALRRCFGSAQLAGGARRARAALAEESGW